MMEDAPLEESLWKGPGGQTRRVREIYEDKDGQVWVRWRDAKGYCHWAKYPQEWDAWASYASCVQDGLRR